MNRLSALSCVAAATLAACGGPAVNNGNGTATGFTVAAPSGGLVAGQSATLTVQAVDASGAVATQYTGTVHVTSDDAAAVLPPDVVFASGDKGSKTASFTASIAGSVTISVEDKSSPGLAGSVKVPVAAGAVTALQIVGLGSTAIAGDALPFEVLAVDRKGNPVKGYRGTVVVASDDPRAELPASYTFTAADAGEHAFALSFATAGSHAVTAGDGSLSATANVQVDADASARVALTGLPGSGTAGVALGARATVQDRFGNTAVGYRGTLHFAVSDPGATPPGDYTFGAGDSGAHAISVAFVTVGEQTLSARDATNASIAGTSSAVSIGAAAADHCVAAGLPANARAGDPLPLRVTVFDPFGNAATSFTGSVQFTSTDARATLPSATAYGAPDAGARDFSVRLGTPGPQTVTATSSAISCHAAAQVSPGAAAQFAIANLPQVAIAGASVAFHITAADAYGNLATDYAGSPVLSSTDPLATFPSVGTFSAGAADATVSFATIGAQSITATDAGASGSGGPVAVHGLVYTAPDTSQGQKLALIADAAHSNAALLALQLVAMAGTKGYSVGFNLPADASRAQLAGAIAAGNALDPGTNPPAMAAALPSSGPLANVLSSGLSQKSAGSGAVTTDAAISAGQILFTVTLRPASAAPGVVFDGAQGGIRAALRDSAGNELLSQADLAVGRLELQ